MASECTSSARPPRRPRTGLTSASGRSFAPDWRLAESVARRAHAAKSAFDGGASEVKAGVSLVRGARALQPDRKHGSSRKAMKLLVRLRRLAVAINPERRVTIRSPGSRCPAVAKEIYYVNGTQTTAGKKGSDAQRSAS